MSKLFLLAFLYVAVADVMDPFRANLLRDHNEKRRQATNAANMVELRWDSALETTAKNYLLRGCAGGFSHNPNRGCDYKNNGGRIGVTSSGCPTVGENWYSGAPDNQTAKDVAMGGAVAQWTDGRCTSWASPPLHCGSTGCSEKQNFYQTGSDSYGSCTQTSGQILHYTQAMWATTTHVGCYYTVACGTLCDYAPGGNMNLPNFGSMREANLWKIGTPCSSCPSGYTTCNRGLCSAGNGTTATTPAPTTTPAPASCAGDSTTKPTNGNAGTCSSGKASGQTCAMACNTGYTLTTGSLTRTCTNGHWSSGSGVVCSAVTCAASSTKPTNGNAGTCTTAKTYGQTCNMACNSGYVLTSGSLVRTCGSTGAWSAVSGVVCSATTPAPTTTDAPYVSCLGDPNTKPINGNAGSCTATKLPGQTCTMACSSGYTLASGSLTRTCGSNGQWSSGTGVTCQATTPAPTTPATTANDYCPSGPTSNLDTEFNWVQLIGYASEIYDANGCPGSTGVSDMTTMRATLAQTQTYALNFDRGTCRYIYQALAGAWIDWNQNGAWEDSEQLFSFSSNYGENSFSFTVPSDAKLGTTRMRVQVQETSSTSIDPCTMFAWGDTKDYTINVIASTPQVTCGGNPNIRPVNGGYGSCLSTKSYGQTCTQTCNPGYQLTAGSLESKCGANGAYSASTAVCTATGAMTAAFESTVACGDTDAAPINGSAGTCGQVTALGSTCTQTCNAGFTLRSGTSLDRLCTTNGYTASTAVCE
jgi:hypothetical protein